MTTPAKTDTHTPASAGKTPTPNKDARKAKEGDAPPNQLPGLFQVVGGNEHVRDIPPVYDASTGRVTERGTTESIPRGGIFEAEGDEAAALRADGGNKFKEVTDDPGAQKQHENQKKAKEKEKAATSKASAEKADTKAHETKK